MCFLFFFFSSRRRHTRCLSDWSSDVCSSDLRAYRWRTTYAPQSHIEAHRWSSTYKRAGCPFCLGDALDLHPRIAEVQIGRASCRERVWMLGSAPTVRKAYKTIALQTTLVVRG